jgi:hypothetical protein
MKNTKHDAELKTNEGNYSFTFDFLENEAIFEVGFLNYSTKEAFLIKVDTDLMLKMMEHLALRVGETRVKKIFADMPRNKASLN